MQFFHAASVGKERTKTVGTEFLIVTELCKGGQLSQYLPTPRHERPFSSEVIAQVMHQTCRAVQHMHNQCPPVMHRDLKIENLLLSEDFVIKLCDFGSASTTSYTPDTSWSALQRLTVQEELEKFTTPMYRAPEMLDLYQNYPIGTAADIWALGCILFYLSCTYHPFEDAAKLAILNAKYTLPPPTSREETMFHSLIRQMLLIDPRQRPDINDVLREVSEVAAIMEIRVSASIPILAEVQKRQARVGVNAQHQPTPGTTASSDQIGNDLKSTPNRTRTASPRTASNRPPHPPAPKATPARPQAPPPTSTPSSVNPPNRPTTTDVGRSQPTPTSTSTSGAGTGNMFGLLKGGAGSLLRNIRDASNKVLESVSSTLSSDLDFQLITSRIAVMSYPAESGLESIGTGNSMEEVQNMLNSRYPNAYAVYNLSPRPYRSDQWFDGRVSHRVFDAHRAPSLRSLIELCLNARLWLGQKPGNLCVVHCMDGRAASAMLVCSLLCFCHLFDNASPALQLFSSKRGNPRLNASQIRYIDYVAQLVHHRVPMPHHRPLKLISLTVTPIPTFNKSKNGCRPYVEVYEGKNQVLSTYTDYDSLRSYVLEDRKIEFLLNGISVLGDLTVIVYHCRSSFAGRGKVAAVKIAQFQLYTGFVEPDQSELIYFKSDLDHLDTSSGFGNYTSRYADSFNLTLEFMVSPNERPRQGKNLVYPWETLPPPESLRPELCVSDSEELRSLLADYGRFNFTQPAIGRSAATVSRQSSEKSGGSVQPTHAEISSGKASETQEDLRPPVDHLVDHEIQDDISANHESETNDSHSDKERTPVADLLGFHIHSPEHNEEHSNNTYSPPIVLIDVGGGSMNETLVGQPEASPMSSDDPFNLDAHPTKPPESDWTAAFDINSGPSSNNPFDPFGIPTGEPDFHYTVSPGLEQTHESDRATKDKPVDLDTIFGPAHLSTSASASDLNSNRNTPLHPSASFSSLSSTAAPTVKSDRTDPFSDFSLFGKPGDDHPDPSDSSTTTKHVHNIGPAASFTNTANSGATPTFEIPQTSRNKFNTGAGLSSNGPASDGTSTTGSAYPPNTPNRTGTRPHVGKDAFSDLLGDFSGASNTPGQGQPKTVNEMRREKLAKTVDPEQLKVQDWAHGKDRNLRALLCSLPGILWDGVKWKPVGITDLMTAEQVKRQYRNAARVIHPDKWMNTEHEQLARMIFVELNDAMAEFEKESGPGFSF
ncbi:DnaJ domain protein [Opisthorchis viverrini]|uniref:DnaJ domain protein n=1 Tax=Opisthorchis viverrini TaxID=6198 RepID=A0A1S8WUH8_OPIVI|nr:DnaJ domain protein [Opisthorchis viverrini]